MRTFATILLCLLIASVFGTLGLFFGVEFAIGAREDAGAATTTIIDLISALTVLHIAIHELERL